MTGVQTCALPICFPVTIGLVERDKIKIEKYSGISDITEDELYKNVSSDEFMKYYEERMKRKKAYSELVEARINLRKKSL